MDCKIIQQRLLEERLGAEVERHLADCQDCRAFQHAMERFLRAKPADTECPGPPERLDSAIREVAESYLETSSANKPRLSRLSIGWLATAAALLLVGWLASMLIHPALNPQVVAKSAPASTERTDAYRQWDINVNNDICDLQIAIELDMATICSSSGDDDGGSEEVLDELDQNDFSLPPIWS